MLSAMTGAAPSWERRWAPFLAAVLALALGGLASRSAGPGGTDRDRRTARAGAAPATPTRSSTSRRILDRISDG